MRLPLLAFLLLLSCSLSAQRYLNRIHYKVNFGDTSQLHQLILLDYTKLLGTAMDIEGEELLFKLRATAEVSRLPVDKLRYLGVYTPTAYYGSGLAYDSTQLFRPYRRSRTPTVGVQDLTLMETALPYASKGRLKIIGLLLATIDWSVNEYFNIGVGALGPLGITFNQRLRHSLGRNLHLGISNRMLLPVLIAAINEEFAVIGDASVMATVGTEDHFFNAGAGYLYQPGTGSETLGTVRFGLGGRLSPRVHLYGELLAFTDNNEGFDGRRDDNLVVLPTFSAALRSRRHRWNLGVLGILSSREQRLIVPIPYLGYQLMWGTPPAYRER